MSKSKCFFRNSFYLLHGILGLHLCCKSRGKVVSKETKWRYDRVEKAARIQLLLIFDSVSFFLLHFNLQGCQGRRGRIRKEGDWRNSSQPEVFSWRENQFLSFVGTIPFSRMCRPISSQGLLGVSAFYKNLFLFYFYFYLIDFLFSIPTNTI